MPFPLLRLPLLPFDEVMKTLDFRQLFTISLCSKRMHSVVKNLRDKSIKLTLTLRVDNKIVIYLLNENQGNHTLLVLTIREMAEVEQEGWRSEKFEGILFEENALGLRTYLADVEVGARAFIGHMSDVFCAPINYVQLNEKRFFWILKCVENLQSPRSYTAVLYADNGLTDDQFRHLFFDLNPSKLYVRTPCEEFQIENHRENKKTFLLSYGECVNIENLLTMDCITLHAPNVTFPVAQINRFLRHVLIDGGAPTLADFVTQLQDDNETERILDGIREVLTANRGREQFEENGAEWKFSGMLKRGGGRVAYVSICCEKRMQPRIFFKRIAP